MKKLYTLLIGIMMIGLVSAWINDSFNDSSSSGNITFTGDENITRWLQVPENAYLTNGYINLTGFPVDDVLRRTNTSSTIWEGVTAQRFNCTEDWNISGIRVYFNLGNHFSNLSFANGTLIYSWTINGANSNTHYLPSSFHCSEGEILSMNFTYIGGGLDRINTVASDSEIDPYFEDCVGGSGCGAGRNVKMIIYNSTYANNSIIYINDNRIWNQTGNLNSTYSPNKTTNLAHIINTYLSGCSYVGGYCDVPIVFHSDTEGTIEYSSMNFTNLLQLSITDESSNVLSPVCSITNGSISDNYLYTARNYRNDTLVCSLTGYASLNEQFSIETDSNKTFIMSGKTLTLNFFFDNGTAFTTNGWVSNNTINTTAFTGSSLIQILRNLYQGNIFVRWNSNGTNPNTDYSQFYEFKNDWIANNVTKNLTGLTNADGTLWIRVVDDGGNPIEGALVRADASNFTIGNDYKQIGQRFTDADGYTMFYGDLNTSIILRVTKDDYDAITIDDPIDLSLYAGTTYDTKATAKLIKLSRGNYSVYDGISIRTAKRFDNLVDNWIQVNVYAPTRQSVTLYTSYSASIGSGNETITLNHLDFGSQLLQNGTHWNGSSTDDIFLYIYVDGTSWGNITIENTNLDRDRFNEPTGLGDGVKRFLIWTVFILTIGILGIFMGDGSGEGQGSYGKGLFMGGAILVALFDISGFKYLLMATSSWFMLIIIRKWVSE